MDQQIQMVEVWCNQVGHQADGRICYLCLNPQCKEKRTCCAKCAKDLHRNCKDGQVLISEVPKLVANFQNIEKIQTNLFSTIIDLQKKIKEVLEQFLGPIKKYKDNPTLGNLEVLGDLLRINKNSRDSVIKFFGQAEQVISAELTKLLLNLKSSIPRLQNTQHMQETPNLNEEADSLFNQSKEQYNKNAKTALNCIEQAIQLVPDNGEYWSQRGKCLQGFGRYFEATESFQQSIYIRPTKEAYQTVSLYMLRQLNDAIQCIEQGLLQFPNNPDLKKDLKSYKSQVH